MGTRILMIGLLFMVSACQYDKEAHFAAGYTVSRVVTLQTGSQVKGCAAAFGIGILKEIVDSTTHYADRSDAAITGAGCSFSTHW